MTAKTLTRDLVSTPERYRLAMSFSDSCLNVLAADLSGDGESVAASIALSDALTPAAALEEAVYSHPMLLLPFGRTDIIAVTSRFLLLTPEAAAADDVTDAIDDMLGLDHPAMVVTDIDSRNSQVSLLDRDTSGFLRRTFDRAAISGHLAVLARYLAVRSRRGNCGKLYVNLREGGDIDLLAFNNRGLAALNTFSCPDDNDAAYYILAMADTAGIDTSGDEIYLTGNPARRAALQPMLAGYASSVLPLIMPQGLRLPRGVNVPPELVVVTLTT